MREDRTLSPLPLSVTTAQAGKPLPFFSLSDRHLLVEEIPIPGFLPAREGGFPSSSSLFAVVIAPSSSSFPLGSLPLLLELRRFFRSVRMRLRRTLFLSSTGGYRSTSPPHIFSPTPLAGAAFSFFGRCFPRRCDFFPAR